MAEYRGRSTWSLEDIGGVLTGLVCVATFLDASEAHIVRGLFESEEIPSTLASEHHVGAFWPLSQALGGVRLQVAAEYRNRALKVLDAYRAGEFEEALFDELGLARSVCPKCGSAKRRPERSWSSIALLAPALVAGVIFPPKQIGYRCRDCGAKVPDVL
jgi:hypothetical protein